MPKKKKRAEDSTVLDFTESSTSITPGAVRKELNIVGLAITILEGPDAGKEYPVLFNKMTIGRKNTDIVIDDPKISRKHAEIEVLGRGYYFVKDLASSNGTQVNGQRVNNQRINPFDKIKIGNSILAVVEK